MTFMLSPRRPAFFVFAVISLALTAHARAAELSQNLTKNEVLEAVRILSVGSYHRAWTAHGIANQGLGLDLGLEATFLFRGSLLDQGRGTAIIPKTTPLPRLWLSWDLPRDFRLSSSYSPGGLYDGVEAFGFGLQRGFWEEDGVRASGLFDYTYANAFGDLSSHTLGLTAQVSKDLDVWQPYAGLGLMLANASVNASKVTSGLVTGTYGLGALRFYVGARIDLWSKLSFQLDFTGFRPSFAVLLSNSF